MIGSYNRLVAEDLEFTDHGVGAQPSSCYDLPTLGGREVAAGVTVGIN